MKLDIFFFSYLIIRIERTSWKRKKSVKVRIYLYKHKRELNSSRIIIETSDVTHYLIVPFSRYLLDY